MDFKCIGRLVADNIAVWVRQKFVHFFWSIDRKIFAWWTLSIASRANYGGGYLIDTNLSIATHHYNNP